MNCQECGKEIVKHFAPSDLKRGKGKFCSLACCARKVNRIREPRKGEDNPNWKGGGITPAIKGRRYRSKYPEKEKAHRVVTNAVANGTIISQPCYKCGSGKSQAHHEDYSKPLDIVWLCKMHHMERHREIKSAA